MDSKLALAVVLLVSVYLVTGTDAWGWRQKKNSSSTNYRYTRPNSKNTFAANATGVEIAVRRVDEEHPYFRAYSLRRNTSLDELKQNLRTFFNQTSNITWIVKNDRLLITRDIEVRMLNSNDQLEAWFTTSLAPTRSKTLYSFTKDARKAQWSSKGDKDKPKDKPKDKTKDKKKDKKKVRRTEEEDNEMASFESFDSF